MLNIYFVHSFPFNQLLRFTEAISCRIPRSFVNYVKAVVHLAELIWKDGVCINETNMLGFMAFPLFIFWLTCLGGSVQTQEIRTTKEMFTMWIFFRVLLVCVCFVVWLEENVVQVLSACLCEHICSREYEK